MGDSTPRQRPLDAQETEASAEPAEESQATPDRPRADDPAKKPGPLSKFHGNTKKPGPLSKFHGNTKKPGPQSKFHG